MKAFNIIILGLLASVCAAQTDQPNPFGDGDSVKLAPTVTPEFYHVESKCTVQAIHDIELPALESGEIKSIDVKLGSRVTVGAHLVQMDDTRAKRLHAEARERHLMADARAKDTLRIEAENKRYELSYKEYQKNKELSENSSISKQTVDRSLLQAQVQWYDWQTEKKNKEIATMEATAAMVTLQASNDSIARHALESPVNGVVYEIHKDVGEWVTAGETVLKIVNMDRLRIPGRINGNYIDPNELENCKVTATLTTANNRKQEFEGSIVYVSVKMNLKNHYLVWAEVENRFVDDQTQSWLLRPGSEVDLRIHRQEKRSPSTAINEAAAVTKK